MGNQQGSIPPASYPSHHYKRNSHHSPQPTVVINFPKSDAHENGHSRHRSPETPNRATNNFLGIPIPMRPRRHSDASGNPEPLSQRHHQKKTTNLIYCHYRTCSYVETASRINVSTSDLRQDPNNVKEDGKKGLLQVPGVYHRQRRKSVDNSAFASPGNNNNSGSSGGNSLIKFHRPSMDSIFGMGRRSRRSSMVDQEPIQIKAPDTNYETLEVPVRERYFDNIEYPSKSDEVDEDSSWSKFLHPDMNTRKRRTRAVSMVEHNHSYNKEDDVNRGKIPTVFKYSVGSDPKGVDNVYLTGNMTNWTCVPMCRPKGELDFYSIIGCRTGDAIFKFNVDGEWTYNKDDEVVRQSDNFWNILKVQESDCDVFNALACDSLVLKDNRRKQPNDEDRKESNAWGQDRPSEDVISSYKNKGPPGLPPHLLQVLLNKEPVLNNSDPVLLPEPLQVSLNHLYAQSIRDNMLVLSTTHRFRKKCVTLVLYKPI